MRGFLALLVFVTALGWAAPAPQTRPWRVGVVGGYSVGYLGLLAMHGLPGGRLDDADLGRPERLRQFDVIISNYRGAWATQAITDDLEKFAFEGGIAVVEGVPALSPAVVPGQRIGPAVAANLRFVASPSAISQGLPELGLMPGHGFTAASIIPDASSKAVVLAVYSDEGVPEKYRGIFTPGGKGAPAILHVPHGKGHLVYVGPCLGYYLSLSGRQYEKFVCNVLNVLSGGQMRDRLNPGDVKDDDLVTLPTAAAEAPPYAAPKSAAGPAPAGFQMLEEADQLQDFRLTAKLPAQGPARVLIGYWSPGNTDQLTSAEGQLTVQRLQGGKPATEAKAKLSAPTGSIVIARDQGLITVAQDGKSVYAGCPGPVRQGLLACQGLTDPAYQPLAPVHFADDFMRESGETSEWENASGAWQVVASEGKADTGANPFNYQIKTDANGAVSLTGQAFWSGLSCRAALQTSAEAAGLIVNYQGPDRYHLLRLALNAADPKASRVQLVQRLPEGEQVLAEAVVPAGKADWHRLELRTSRGRLQGWLNRRLVVQATCDAAAAGRLGLLCKNGPAAFDDVVVEPWTATPPLSVAGLRPYLTGSGGWAQAADGVTISGWSRSQGRLVVPWQNVTDCLARVRVRPGPTVAGLMLRSGPNGYLAVTLQGSGKSLKLRAVRRGKTATTLGEQSVPGSAGGWHDLTASASGPALRVTVDGRPVLSVVDTTLTSGAPGLVVSGPAPAQFRDFAAWQEAREEQLADEPMPSFAGIIDRHTWAGRSGAWRPDPAHLDCFWHQGFFPGDVRLDVGVHPTGEVATQTALSLGRRLQPASGVLLTAQHAWNTDTVRLSLSVQGKAVASGKGVVTPAKPYALCLERLGQDVLVRVNRQLALRFHDARTRPEWDSLGLDNGGQLITAQDVAVTSPGVHDYTFETAPTDWEVESGQWKLSSRWSCSPGWSWLGGLNNEGPALIRTRAGYTGDLDLVMYVAAKMFPVGNSYTERLTDVHVVCAAADGPADSGYHFVLGGANNTWSGLLRQGQKVLDSPYRIPQTAIHNDWLRLTLRRRGPTLTLWAWETQIMTWQDPSPLPGGAIRLGTEKNGMLIPRVTIFGQQAAHNLPTAPPAPKP